MTKSNESRELPYWPSAFGDSLLPSLGAPVVIVLIAGIVSGSLPGALLLILFGGLVHLACYFLIGIPFFAFFWEREESLVWKWWIALPLGVVLGGLPIGVAVMINGETSFGEILECGLLGAPYGFLSALASLYIRWKHVHAYELATIRLETAIHAPLERVFDLARSIEVHTAGAEETGERAVDGVTSGLVAFGDTVTWEARHFGVKQRLTARVTKFEKNVLFEDVMLMGAFDYMRHTHCFVKMEQGTLMVDEFHYRAPFGILGRCVENIFLTNYMRRFLLRKNAKLKQIAESEDWRKFL